MTAVALIDDHAILCNSLSSLINDFEGSMMVWCANDEEKAIQLLEGKENVPDIVLLDIIMPGMSGIKVAK
jgi:DNA-binding NarL/FixJ family response regulator